MGDELRKTDEWGHVETRTFPDGSVAGVIERGVNSVLPATLAYSKNGKPDRGYDRVFGYKSVDGALEALRAWEYPGPPPNPDRNYQTDPIE